MIIIAEWIQPAGPLASRLREWIADVETVADDRLDGADPDIQGAGQCAGEEECASHEVELGADPFRNTSEPLPRSYSVLMRFGVLGPVTAWTDDGAAVRIPDRKVRALLADLLLHAGRPVAAATLIDDLWGDELPGNPTATLQTRVSQLRKALDEAEPGARDLIETAAPGYLISVPAEAVDAGRFRALATRARQTGSARMRAATLADALTLWRGPAYADVGDDPFARAAIDRLDEERLAVQEAYAEARLELGEHEELVAELTELVAGHPLRQRLRAVQLRALHRAGRQAEALESYADLRHRLADELGLDPSPDLVALQQRILADEPEVAPSEPGARRSNLPVAVTDLIGRTESVDELAGTDDRRGPVDHADRAGRGRQDQPGAGRRPPVRRRRLAGRARLARARGRCRSGRGVDRRRGGRPRSRRPARAGQLRTRRRGRGRGDRPAAPGRGGAADPRHQPGGPGHRRRTPLAGAAAGPAVVRRRCRRQRRGPAVRGPGGRGRPDLPAGPGHRRRGGRRLPSAGRAAAGAGTGREPGVRRCTSATWSTGSTTGAASAAGPTGSRPWRPSSSGAGSC